MTHAQPHLGAQLRLEGLSEGCLCIFTSQALVPDRT